jgi:hypothetical protein
MAAKCYERTQPQEGVISPSHHDRFIRKSRYNQQESVASRVQLHNPTIDPDSNDAAHHRACFPYERQDEPCLNLDETYSFLDHYDQNLHFHL